jgi:hypothetical protein
MSIHKVTSLTPILRLIFKTIYFSPLKRRENFGLAPKEDEYVPIEKEKISIRQSWVTLELHENITHELLNIILFFASNDTT